MTCEKKELLLDKLKGLLVLREDAVAGLAEACAEIRLRLETIPSELASTMPADQRDVTLADCRDKVRMALKSLERLSE